jgi:hypothetical protein
MPSNRVPALPPSLEQKLRILDALARERLMDVHLRYAMELVDHAQTAMTPSAALAIYVRLHHLRGVEAEGLYQRIFVALGNRNAPKPFDAQAAAEEAPESIIGVIRRRLRGRINHALREWVEYHTGRAETELLWAHVENAMQFVALLEPFVAIDEAVEHYTRNIGVLPAQTETIYYLLLAHRSSNPQPVVAAAEEAPKVGQLADLPRETTRRLRIIPSPRPSGSHGTG